MNLTSLAIIVGLSLLLIATVTYALPKTILPRDFSLWPARLAEE